VLALLNRRDEFDLQIDGHPRCVASHRFQVDWIGLNKLLDLSSTLPIKRMRYFPGVPVSPDDSKSAFPTNPFPNEHNHLVANDLSWE